MAVISTVAPVQGLLYKARPKEGVEGRRGRKSIPSPSTSYSFYLLFCIVCTQIMNAFSLHFNAFHALAWELEL